MNIIDALKEAERFMEYFAGETRNVFVGSGTPKECLAQIRAALAAPRKPLDWETYNGDESFGESREHYGYHEFGYYVASKANDAWSVNTFTSRGKARVVGFYGTLADAKAGAQKDFDERAALTAAPASAAHSNKLRSSLENVAESLSSRPRELRGPFDSGATATEIASLRRELAELREDKRIVDELLDAAIRNLAGEMGGEAC